ncbi:MAG: TolC family protein [Myxococcales bacterium]
MRRRRRRRLGKMVLGTLLVAVPCRAEVWLELDQAMARARSVAPAVVEAETAVQVARAAEVGARLPPFGNPSVEVFTGQQRHAELEVDAKLYLPWEVAGQRSARMAEASQWVSWRKLGERESKARVVGEVVVAWGMVVISAAKVEQSLQAEQEAEKEAQWVSARYEQSASTLVDKSFAQSETMRWAQTRAEAQTQLQMAQFRLAYLMATPTTGLPRARDQLVLPEMRAPSEQDLVRKLLEETQLLKVIEAESAFWRSSTERAMRERTPPLNLVFSGGRGDMGEPRFTGGLAWSIPVLRRNQGEIARSEAERMRADALRVSLRGALEARIRSDWHVYHTARNAVLDVDTRGMPATEQLVAAAYAAWRGGKGELVQVLIARRDLAAARMRRLDLVATAWRAYGDLVALTGERP